MNLYFWILPRHIPNSGCLSFVYSLFSIDPTGRYSSFVVLFRCRRREVDCRFGVSCLAAVLRLSTQRQVLFPLHAAETSGRYQLQFNQRRG